MILFNNQLDNQILFNNQQKLISNFKNDTRKLKKKKREFSFADKCLKYD